MKLLLTSNGASNSSIVNALRSILEKPFEKSSITFIPTAANVERGDKKFVVNDMYTLMKLGFETFDVMDISAVSKQYWLESFQRSDVLVFGGGNDKYLLDWLRSSGVQEALPALLQNKVYMGISAGSMVTEKKVSLSTAGILYYERTQEWENTEGLGFVDFEIRPHLNSPDFPKVRLDYLEKIAKENPTPFYAIDDNSAVVVNGNSITVVSEGDWKKFN
jgi:dipeptidase E